MSYYVYILASQPRGTLYFGVTADIVRRVYEHNKGLIEGFTIIHGVKTLVYFETHDRPQEAIQREKNLKHWVRDWKVSLIERENPHWEDLYEAVCG